MGDALVSGLVDAVLGRLTSVAIAEFRLVWGFKEDVSTLKDYFIQIQAVLHDAEKRRINEETVELWLKRLRSESLKMENVFDEISTEALLQKLHKKLGIKHRVRAFFSSSHNQLMFRIRNAHKVKQIRKEIADIAAQRSELNLTGLTPYHGTISVVEEMPSMETSSFIHSSNIFGRNEEMKMIVEKICKIDVVRGIHDPNDVRVYAIWGMGGLGKTTLAQLVYNHQRVNNHFDLKCWMYVSRKFQVKELLRGIIESIDKSERSLSQLDEMQKYLQEKLQGKRFLIVLDDVWIEDNENTKWEDLSKTLRCGAEGSIVMVTTRSKTTSRMTARVLDLQHELGCLLEQDSWSLFKNFAFAQGREGGDIAELEPIGKDIVDKCQGLPLALKTMGSLMWSKSSTRDWQNMTVNKIWKSKEIGILPALKLSYDNLLPHLKRCFAYCCMFPKGYQMKKDLLILLWLANDLIPPRGEANWYILGEEIYNCLLWRSFFQVVDGKYKMHDLMHDLAENVMSNDCLIMEPGKKVITLEEVLHLSSSGQNLKFSSNELKSLISLRSMFIFEAKGGISQIFDFVYLRVLYLVGLDLKTLPESICRLKYLKYLNLSNSKIKVLPESIIYLQNLQMLILEGCMDLCKLPEGMRYMRNLQYLNIKECFLLKYLPVGIKGLTGLRMLSCFPIDKKNGAKIRELGDLNLLEGELEIFGLENVEGGLKEAENANLKRKTNLVSLKLEWREWWSQIVKEERIGRDEEVLKGLEPNPSLKELEIRGCMGKNISPSWIVNLNNLVSIDFTSCKKCEIIPPLGKLPYLKSMELWKMESLKCFHDEDKNTLFPTLQNLTIHYCPRLVSLPRYFPKLKQLRIIRCESLLSLPDEIQSFKDLNYLEIGRCENLRRRYEKESGVDWPKVSHIPNICIDYTIIQGIKIHDTNIKLDREFEDLMRRWAMR